MSGTVKRDVERVVVGILAEQAAMSPEDVRLGATLEDLGIDSLGVVETIFSIEEAFDVQVPFNSNQPEASEFDIHTVGSIVRSVESLIAART
jgi:acyl carrier protein